MPDVPSPRTWAVRVAAEPGESMSALPADHPAPPAKPRRRPRRRLRILLAINTLAAVLYAFSQLDPTTVKKLGPGGEYVFDLLHPPLGLEVSPTGQRLEAEVSAMAGQARIMERSRRYLGFFGTIEYFAVSINEPNFGDDALASLVKQYGDRIWALDLRNTHVSDQGLRHLEGLFPGSNNSRSATTTTGFDHLMRSPSARSPTPASCILRGSRN